MSKITKSHVCGVTCHKGGTNCNGYCVDELVPAPATYEVAQTFGEKAVGLSFNPSGDDAVANCKKEFAAVIDRMDVLRNENPGSVEIWRMTNIAIDQAQTAQMWAVKALTWRD